MHVDISNCLRMSDSSSSENSLRIHLSKSFGFAIFFSTFAGGGNTWLSCDMLISTHNKGIY